MHDVRAAFKNAGFDAETTAAMGAAFDTAWQILKTREPHLGASPLAESARMRLAKFVIELAQHGVKDPLKLTDAALGRIGIPEYGGG